MPYSSNLGSLSLSVFLFFCIGCSKTEPVEKPEINPPVVIETKLKIDTVSILSDKKLELTKAYSKMHYGINNYVLDSPKMIVVHYTVIPTLKQTIALFKRDELSANRKFIKQYSSLNVGIHYVVDYDGKIYNLLPDSIIARHIIGFNHVSIGIENIAGSKDDLTAEQLASNVALIKMLKSKHPTIQYLIGHDEYNIDSLPHYSLFKSLDASYKPYDKPDPGKLFMANIRQALLEKHDLEFLD